MCNINEHVPTQLERRTLKEGYKIFALINGKLCGNWHNSFQYKEDTWNTINDILCSDYGFYHSDYGFYVFLNKEDVKAVVKHRQKRQCDFYTLIIKKVQIKSLVAIGNADGFSGASLVRKDGVVRCKKLKIVED